MSIIINNVSKKIGNDVILDDINLTFEEGKIYGLVGRNGSGKSMILKTICGFIKPDTGFVLVNDNDIYKTCSFPDDTGALLDVPNYIPDLTGFENLQLLAQIQNKIGNDEIIEALKMVNLYESKDKKFKKYSLGMKQKLGIAQALMENPKIIILDEPFNGLEDESCEKIRKLLIDEKNKNKIIIIATHIKEDIESLCDVVYRVDNGKIKE